MNPTMEHSTHVIIVLGHPHQAHYTNKFGFMSYSKLGKLQLIGRKFSINWDTSKNDFGWVDNKAMAFLVRKLQSTLP